MPNTCSALYTHLVFSTKLREPMLNRDIRPRLFEYMGGICRGMSCSLIDAGGVEDHVHLLVRRHTSFSESELLRDIKGNSSRWLKQFIPGFGWQDGGGAFSVEPKDTDAVRVYLANQEAHHAQVSFLDELELFLKSYGIEFERKYLDR